MSKILNFTDEQFVGMLVAGQQEYAKNGFTTVQEGRTDPKTLKRLVAAWMN